jgi:hypothetical protein
VARPTQFIADVRESANRRGRGTSNLPAAFVESLVLCALFPDFAARISARSNRPAKMPSSDVRAERFMDPLTPEQLRDLYRLLPIGDRGAFLRLIGAESKAEYVAEFLRGMTVEEQRRFSMIMNREIAKVVYPFVLRHAVDVANEMGHLSREEQGEEVLNRHADSMETYRQYITSTEVEKLKAKRNRKSNPETIRKNVEICDLRLKDPKHWSLARLAGKFKVTKRAISKVVEEEAKWRRLAADDLGTN